jgi:Ca2+-binding RTX toxin-like protein
MASFQFSSITGAQASAYNGATDSLDFGAGPATQASVAYLSGPEQVAISFGGATINFGTGIYGDTDLTFADGGHLFVGGTGADAANGTGVSDGLFGGVGGDTLAGGDGADALQGNQGADSLAGGNGDDTVYGGQDGDTIVVGSAGGEANFTNGNKGADTITASAGHDTLLGGQDNDMLVGGPGGDFLNGNLGDDNIQGGAAADIILGEGGRDVMSGGGGTDTFIFGAGASDVTVAGADVITDWTAADRIQLPVQGGYLEFDPSMGGGGGMGGYGYDYDYGYTPPPTAAAVDMPTALTTVNGYMGQDPTLRIAAAQVNADVVVFVDTNGDHQADLAVVLANTTLAAVDASNFI